MFGRKTSVVQKFPSASFWLPIEPIGECRRLFNQKFHKRTTIYSNKKRDDGWAATRLIVSASSWKQGTGAGDWGWGMGTNGGEIDGVEVGREGGREWREFAWELPAAANLIHFHFPAPFPIPMAFILFPFYLSNCSALVPITYFPSNKNRILFVLVHVFC